MNIQPLSESTEMYLKAMAELSDQDLVATARLADHLNVTPVSVNEMVRRLSEQGLMTHTPYKGVMLTKKGRKVASDVMRRQRLWECTCLLARTCHCTRSDRGAGGFSWRSQNMSARKPHPCGRWVVHTIEWNFIERSFNRKDRTSAGSQRYCNRCAQIFI